MGGGSRMLQAKLEQMDEDDAPCPVRAGWGLTAEPRGFFTMARG
jgi:hypothetical protein